MVASAFSVSAYGMSAALNRFEKSASRVAETAGTGKDDIVSDFVEQIEARQAFEANAEVMKTAQSMTGRLLDLKA
jgi:flagellar basal body rod protein FlgC